MYIDNQTEHHYPSEPIRLCSRKLIQNFVFRSHDFVYCHTLLPFALLCLSSLCRLLRHAVLHPIACHRSSPLIIVPRRSSSFLAAHHRSSSLVIVPCCSSSLLAVSSRILLGILFIYIFSLFSHLSHRLLKKGLTSPCSFHSFCRFIPLQAYHCSIF
jgi:hypothetical protein